MVAEPSLIARFSERLAFSDGNASVVASMLAASYLERPEILATIGTVARAKVEWTVERLNSIPSAGSGKYCHLLSGNYCHFGGCDFR